MIDLLSNIFFLKFVAIKATMCIILLHYYPTDSLNNYFGFEIIRKFSIHYINARN
jgi:hypothetical protein